MAKINLRIMVEKTHQMTELPLHVAINALKADKERQRPKKVLKQIVKNKNKNKGSKSVAKDKG